MIRIAAVVVAYCAGWWTFRESGGWYITWLRAHGYIPRGELRVNQTNWTTNA